MNIYHKSSAVQKLQERLNKNVPLKIAFLDIDDTFTGDPANQTKARTELEKQGYVIIFVSSRFYELMLSDKSIQLSPTLDRAPSKSARTGDGLFFHQDLAEIDQFNGLLDADIISQSSGMHMIVKQNTGEYVEDKNYFNSITVTPTEWREKAYKLIVKHSNAIARAMENKDNYEKNIVDVSPFDYRIILDFPDASSLKECMRLIKEVKAKNPSFPLEYINDSHPERKGYTLYLIPVGGNDIKRIAVDTVVKNITTELQITPQKLEVLLTGDAYIDMAMGFFGAEETQGIFLLAGGSRLLQALVDDDLSIFDQEDISHLKKEMKKIEDGIYTFRKRKIVISDILYPGKKGPEGILAFLQDERFNTIPT